MRVLVTGGAGYIGSHTVLALVEGGHEPVILDNFSNSSRLVLSRLEELSGRTIPLEEGDVRDVARLAEIMRRHELEAVIHFAAYKAVGESWEKPLDYFDNNISGTIGLLRAMRQAGVRRLVFSSSCTVYGDARNPPISEDAPLQVANPYGRTKLVMEQLIGDVCIAHEEFRAAILRYFNPVGAHPSGRIGEDPLGEPNNLMPYVTQVAVGRRESVRVFGNDYPTRDGSGVRDYIHVVDLASAHLAALDYLAREDRSITVNLGTGRGYS
ncbi:MAG: UDP-glucose 4-epimerase GalE, partial [Acidobacteria bacterium]|nr:UDP-glucose 4-epimerase GalE [Acidobacteriota bacterium]